MRFPSWSLIPPPDDPSTLFIVAGHAAAEAVLPRRRASRRRRAFTTVQKVLRAGGKDTDLDEVGLTARHASIFEMLGNFSFGDYFKDGAIDFAWEFVTEHMELEPDRLWADACSPAIPELGLGEDEVAVDGWLRKGLPRERIVGLPALGELLGPRRRDRARAARARSSTTTAARSTAAASRTAGRTATAATASSSSGTSSSWSSTSTRDGHADAAPEPEHRHGPRARARRDAAPGRRLDLRHRRLPADHGLDRARSPVSATARRRQATKAHRVLADHGRGDDVPDRRGRRRRRTRAAATSCAG